MRIIFPRALLGSVVERPGAKHVGSAAVAMNATHERIKRDYPPLKMKMVFEIFLNIYSNIY